MNLSLLTSRLLPNQLHTMYMLIILLLITSILKPLTNSQLIQSMPTKRTSLLPNNPIIKTLSMKQMIT